MPTVDDLPEDLQALVRRQAVELNHKQWDATSGELIRTLEKILDASDTSPPSTVPPQPEPPAPKAPAATPPTPGAATTWWRWAVIAAVFLITAGAWFALNRAPAPPAAPTPVRRGADEEGAGAGVGAVTGAVRGLSEGERDKVRVVKQCLRGRGYRVLN